MADHGSSDPKAAGAPPNVHLWTRDGFLGANAVALRPNYTPEYRSVSGPHAPHRLDLLSLPTADTTDAAALPSVIMTSKNGVTISLSRRRAPTPYTLRNAECDELHFLQTGKCRFVTDFGSIDAGPLDFVCIPRAVSYRVEPLSDDIADVIVESPEPIRFDTPAPFGMINFGKSVRRAALSPNPPHAAPPHVLLIKSDEGCTRFEMAHDPLPAIAHVGGTPPVWALNLRDIAPLQYGPTGGPPGQFASTPSTGVMLYTMSARSGGRPPIHHNADYDEIVLYAAGPGAWGAVTEPGTLTWVPKAVTHHGPSENVPEGYQAWLLENRGTFRLTAEAKAKAVLMETGLYGVHKPGA